MRRLALTQAQRALWDLHLASAQASVAVAYYLSLTGPLDTDLLGQVGREYVARRATLFLRFEAGAEGVATVHDPSLDDSNVAVDFRDEADPLAAAREWMVADASAPLDPTRDRTALFGLLRVADDQHLIYMRGHHLVADGVAAMQLLDEWGRLYTEAVEGREPSYPAPEDFGPALEADAAYLTSTRRERDRDYWREQLSGVPPPSSLSRRSGDLSSRTHQISGLIPASTAELVRQVEAEYTTTLPAVIGTVLTIYLSRMTGQRDVQIALPVAARTVAALRKTPLPVSNVVPIRTQLSGDTTVADALRATQSSMLGALRHQRYRYEDIRADLAAAGTPVPATPGVTGAILNLMLIEPTVRFGDATGTVQIISTGPIDDLSVTIYPRVTADGTLATQVDLDTNPHRYTADETRTHHARLLHLLDEMCRSLLTDPDSHVVDLALLDDDERAAIQTVTGPAAPEPTSLATLLAENALESPSTPAIEVGGAIVTYGDLTSTSSQPDAVIGGVATVERGRGIEQSVGIWATARRPEPLLVLDPDLPPQRRDRIVELVGTANLPVAQGAEHPDGAEYLVFTSGTTGEPKGVVVPHRGIAALAAEFRSRFATDEPVRVAQLASPAFDATILEHILAAALGGTVIPAPTGALSGEALAQYLNDNRITHALVTPSVLATITPDALEPGVLTTLMTGGEALPAGLAATWATGRSMHNLYGPAETTIVATAAHITADENGEVTPTIGRPITGTSVHVLDARLQPVPFGAPGELYVSGPSLALGYLGDTTQTATRFVADPYLPGQRMYRTGDLVAWDHDLTELLYLGRADDQVQIRGVRVELEEVESTASRHPDVDAAAATVADDALALYVVTQSPTTVRPGLRRLFAERLSPAMWPSRIVAVNHLPITPTGKVDRDALASLTTLDSEAPYAAPSTAAERAVAAVVAEVLGVDEPSLAADIVDLGATSLNSTEIATALARRTGSPVTVRDVLTSVSLQELAARVEAATPVVVPPRTARPPASPQQAAMVVAARMAPESTAEVLVGSVTLRGAAGDVVAAREAVGHVVARHEILRTVVRVDRDGSLWQDVRPTDEAVAAMLVDDVLPDPHSVIDPTSSIPARLSVRVHGENLVVAVAVHHALVDDASIEVLAADLAVAWAARRDGEAPEWTDTPVQYADAAAIIDAALGEPGDPASLRAQQLSYWTETLRDLPARPRWPGTTGQRDLAHSAQQVSTSVAQTEITRTYAAAHAVIAAVTARFTGSLDLTLATVHTGRDLLPARPAVGMFVNPVAIRTQLQPGITFDDMVTLVDGAVREARLHGDVPIADVARAVEPTRAPTTAPLSDVLISYRGVDRASVVAAQMGLAVDVHQEPARDPRVPLQWNLDHRADGLRISLTYDTAVLAPAAAQAMIDAAAHAFASATPESLLHELVPGPAGALPPRAAAGGRTVVDVVLKTARSRATTALVDGEVRYSYTAVVDAARAIGSGLAAFGVGAGHRVAVALPRGGRAVIAQLGVQMTGAAYVPVDITLPPARIAAILEDAAPAVVLGALDGHRSVGLDDLDADPEWQPVPIPADAEAYVIFTSGSTGRPKGVSVSHRAVVAMLDGVAENYSPTDVFSCVHSLAFDFSVFEVLAPWRVGASVVLADADTIRDPAALWRFVQDNRITVLSQTPPAFEALAAEAIRVGEGVTALDQVVFGGSALHFDRLWQFAATVGKTVGFTNMWGITEGAVHVTTTPVAVVSERRSLIGEPLPAMAIAVLDVTLQPVPTGVWGELYIAGAQLADGYVGPTARTAERFVAAAGGTRMYRTGDIVRRTHDGQLEYLGRADSQVQLRGFRVELAEVEAAVRSAPGVVDAVVSVRDGSRVDGGVLIAYVVGDVDPSEVRSAAATVMPAYAVPSQVTVLDAIPLTSSGKIDRTALPAPGATSASVLSGDASEFLSTVRTVVGGVLGREPEAVDPSGSLLDLGAHSLSYMHIAVGLASATGRQPAVRDIVAAPTVAALAEVLAAAPPIAAAAPAGPVEYTPSAQQRGLWFLHQLDPNSTVYHLPLRVDLDPAVGLYAVRAAAVDVIGRHEILRTVLVEQYGAPVARVLPIADAAEHVDAAIVGRRVVTAAELDAAVDEAARGPFDLAAPGWRMHLFDLDSGAARVLVLVAHHAVADGWSVQILGGDVLAAITARTAGREPDWAESAEAYSAVAARATAAGGVSAESVAYWRQALDGAPTQLSLPRPAASAPPGPEPAKHLEAPLAPGVRDRLVAVADACGVTPFHVVHVALTQVLATVTGDEDVVVGVPTVGRDTATDFTAVGMFVRMAVLRTRVGVDVSLRDAVAASAGGLTDATGEHAIDYEDLVAAVAPGAGSARQPYLDVIVSYAEDPGSMVGVDALDAELVRSVTPIRVPHARVPLEFTVTDRGADGVDVVLTVGVGSVDVSAAQRILADVVAVLGSLADGGADVIVDDVVPRESSPVLVGPPGAGRIDPVIAFRDRAASTPGAVAVVDGDRAVDYAALLATVDQFVESLAASGVGAGTRVMLTGGRSAATLAVSVAIHELGATLVPVDPSYPARRVAEIQDAVWPAVPVVVEEDHPDGTVFGARVLTYAAIGVAQAEPRPISDDLPAYIIHTSGSTGAPKGVVVTRGNLASMLSATLPLIDTGPTDVWTWSHSPAFDFSVWETWGALTTGGTVVVVDGDTARDPSVLSELIDRRGVTVLSQTPTAFAPIAERGEEHPSLRWVVFGGEALAPSTLAPWAARHRTAQLLNLYGITETTVHLTQQVVDVDDVRSVIGVPLAGMTVRVLDARLRPVPVGARGELYVVGPQVSAGYLGQPGLTSERFVAGPGGQRMYRTGDHVRRIDDERLEYLGRTDDQVQIRGFRVELGEVVAALRAAPGVVDARVVVRPGPVAGDETLIGFVVGPAVDDAAVRESCARVLPAQSVPAVVVAVDGWPLTPTGKVDTAALLRLAERSAAPGRSLTPQEQVVAAVVADLTGTDPAGLGPDSSFFALGGSSLTAARLAAGLSDVAGATVTVRAVFENPTIAMLAAIVDAGHDVGVVRVPGPSPMARPERLSLTPQQEEVWLQWSLHPDDTGYHLVAAVPLDDSMVEELRDSESRAAVESRVRDVIARHDALRTRYPVDVLGPRQELVDVDDIAIDLTPRATDDAVAVVAEVLAPFDLAVAPPWRIRVADTGSGVIVGAAIHHIAADGRSVAVLERELAALASREGVEASPVAVDFASYTQWYRSMLAARSDDLHRFWRGVFAEPIRPIRLPGVASTVGERSGEPSAIAVAVLDDLDHLRDWVVHHRTTVFIAVHAALASVIARRGASGDVVVGTATSGRVDAAVADTVGMFARTVPLRTEIDVDRPFDEVVADVTAADLDAFAHADLPAAEIAAIADPDRSTAGRALTAIVLSDLMTDREGSTALATDVEALARTGLLRTVFGLDFSVAVTDGTLRIALVYRPSTVDEAVAQGMVDDVVRVLTAALSHPDVVVGDVLVASTAQSTSVTAHSTSVSAQSTSVSAQSTGVGSGGGAGSGVVTFGGVLAATAAAYPDRVALVDGDESFTYADLDARARAIAAALRARGVGRGDIVATHAPRSTWSVLATWGISYAGAAFLAVNPTDPPARRARVLGTAAPAVVLTAPGHPVDDVAEALGSTVVVPLEDTPERAPTARGPMDLTADDLAYVVFTSGSTGTPKGVAVSHRGIGPLLATMRDGLPLSPETVLLHNYAPSFDAHIIELLLGFSSGGTVVICPPDVIGGDAMHEVIAAHGVNTVLSTPAVLSTLDPDRMRDVSLMTVGGEAVPQRAAAQWSAGRQLVNFYGPTETTIVVTTDLHMDDGPVDIGEAVAGSQAVVLDGRLRAVPDNTVGELYIRGASLARGYLGRPDLTAERFVADPAHPGARMYRTGDLVHRRADGTLVTHGRTDTQLAVRGLRVEPAEIDAALVTIPGVRDAVSDLQATPSGADVLAAWVVPDDTDHPIHPDEIRRAARDLLPRGMVPTLITVLDDLPRTANGKLDRRALPAPDMPPGRPAQTPTELAIVAVWSEIIGVDAETIDTASDFFSLGGSSFTATRVVGRLRETTGRDVTVRQVFDARTVAELAADLDAMEPSDARGVRPVHLPTPASVPLAFPQRRMWFLNRLDPESTAYTVPVVARIVGPADPDRIRRALRRLAVRHESLRTVYPDTPDGPRQVVLAPDDVAMPEVARVDVAEADQVVRQIITAPIDLTTSTAFRAVLVEVAGSGDADWLLVAVMHHVAVDGFSLRTLLADLATAYTDDADLPAPELTYIDVTRWQLGRLGDPDDPDSTYARQLRFWRQTLAGLGEPQRLPGHDESAVGEGGRVAVVLPDDVTRAVDALAQRVGATTFHAVHAAVATVLARWTGTSDVVVAAPVLGRPDPAMEPVVGMFVNTVALRTAIDPAASAEDVLAAVRDADLTAMANDGVPYDAVARAVRPDHCGRHDPLVSVLVVQQEARAVLDPSLLVGGIPLGDSRIEPIAEVDELVAAKFDVEVVVGPDPTGALQLIVLHAPAVPVTTARALAEQVVALLTAAATDPSSPFPVIEDGLTAVPVHPASAVESVTEPALPGIDIPVVRAVFAEVLGTGVDEIGPDDDLFALGGTSLSTTQVVSALARRTGRRLAVAEVFAHPTAAALAASVAGAPDTEGGSLASALATVIARGPVHGRVPLSTAQRRIWFADRMARGRSDVAMYAVPVLIPLADDISDARVQAAVHAVVDRHAPLRTTYPIVDGDPYQVVLRSFRPDVRVVDLGDVTWAQALASPPPELVAHLTAPFDLSADPPVRAVSIRAADGRVLLMVVHHIALDGQSVGILSSDLAEALSGRWLAPLDVTYAQWSMAEAAVPAAIRATDRARVLSALEGYPGVLDLPTDRPRTASRSLATASTRLSPDAAVVDAIPARARAAGVTPFHLWHGALVLALAGAADTDDVAVGTPVSVRSVPEIAPVAGMFVSTAVLRTRVTPTDVDTFLSRIRDVDTEAIGSTLVGFDEIVAAVRPPRDPGRHPLVQVLLSQTPDVLPALPIGLPDGDDISAPSEFDLQFTVAPDGSVIVTRATDLFDEQTAVALGERWLRALTAMVTAPAAMPVDAIDLRSPAEVARDAVDRSVLAMRPPTTLQDVFAHATTSFVEEVAVDDGAVALTYADLDRRSAAMASRLLDAGVHAGDRVAMMLPRSVESVIATWAVVRTGAVLVPVDPYYPAERVARMLTIADARVAVVGAFAGDVPVAGGIRTVEVDPVGEDLGEVEAVDWARPLVDAPAYVIFTSGSTGLPNAVTVTHRGLSLFADPIESGLTSEDRVAHHSSPSFDAAVFELVRAAGSGARLSVIAPDRVGGEAGTAELARLGATTLFTSPTVLATLDPARLPALRLVEVGGEAVPRDIVQRWAIGRDIATVYGPTESTIMVLWDRTDADLAPGPMLGRQADSVGIAVLDRRLRPVPDGCVGELYLLGPALAQGYIDAALTASRFVAADDGARMYRTGDLVRRTPVGLAFAGRADQQVQIRGVRVEPAEVDAAAIAAGARRATTLAVAGPSGDTLVTYAVSDLSGDVLRSAMGLSLPAHLVPAQVIVVDELPVTPVGKLDVAALPAPQWGGGGAVPRTPTEETVLSVFRSVIGDDSIGVDDEFFAVGGTSLQLIPLVGALREAVGAEVALESVVAHPTPAALAAEIDAGAAGSRPEFAPEIADLLQHVIPLAEGADPLWLVHPASGLASMYRPLAEAVGGGVLGMQLPDLLDPTPTSPSTVDDLAARHLDAVRERQPHGPYRFGGWSVGGQIAHRMAQLAVTAGETVALLVLLDALVGVDVAAAGDDVVGIDPATAEALRAADAARFAAYTARIDAIARSAAAFDPQPIAVDHTVLVVASDTTDEAADHWRSGVVGRVTAVRVDADHADLGEPATMRAIGEMLAVQTAPPGADEGDR
ncbi:non-ribosomal peptide synthetase [Williamsia deligens]|uniref:Non-ribosomal peptide synthetase n=1 Tax=Williamsia deligens TaxID=321325 RepID=A0ABW3G3I9_9NOCA|nr:non-ribosomal peptide synthetase [Williamsia deligens]